LGGNERAMFKIGDFSRLTRVSVKMLRHYDEIGLLRPARIDLNTGYRYYSADQLPRLNRIIALKDLGFGLDQIGVLLAEDLSPEEIRGMLKLRRAELEQHVRADLARLTQIETRLRQIEQGQHHEYADVVLRAVEGQSMATLRRIAPNGGQYVAQMFTEVEAYVAAHKARAFASPLTIYYDTEYREENFDLEVAVPISREIPDYEAIRIRELPAVPMVACAVYTGSYAKGDDVLNALLVWVETNGYQIAGPMREVYVRFGVDPEPDLGIPSAFLAPRPQLYVTEVQLPISETAA